MYHLKMQNKKLRNFKQTNLIPVSSGPASKLKRLAIILTVDNNPLTNAVIAIEPG